MPGFDFTRKTALLTALAVALLLGGGFYLHSVYRTPPIKDCIVWDIDRDENVDGRGLGAGSWNGHKYRTLFTFNQYSFPPADEQVTSVELRLYGAAVHSNAEARAFYVSWGVNWDEDSVTWNTHPSIGTYHRGEYEISLLGETSDIPGQDGWFSIPIDKEFMSLYTDGFTDDERLNMIIYGVEDQPDGYWHANDMENKNGDGPGPEYTPELVFVTGSYGTVDVTVTEDGGSVEETVVILQDGQEVTRLTSPDSTSIPAGTYTAQCTRNEETKNKTFTLTEGGTASVSFSFTTTPEEEKGTLYVEATLDGDPLNAQIEVVNDVTYTGSTPYEKKLLTGGYAVSCTHGGQTKTETAVIVKDQTTAVTFSFETPTLRYNLTVLAVAVAVAAILLVVVAVYRRR